MRSLFGNVAVFTAHFSRINILRTIALVFDMKMPEKDSNLKLTLKPSGRFIDGCPIPMKYRYANVCAPECDFSQIESSQVSIALVFTISYLAIEKLAFIKQQQQKCTELGNRDLLLRMTFRARKSI